MVSGTMSQCPSTRLSLPTWSFRSWFCPVFPDKVYSVLIYPIGCIDSLLDEVNDASTFSLGMTLSLSPVVSRCRTASSSPPAKWSSEARDVDRLVAWQRNGPIGARSPATMARLVLADPGTRGSEHTSEGWPFRGRLHGYLVGFTACGKQLKFFLSVAIGSSMQCPRVYGFQVATSSYM